MHLQQRIYQITFFALIVLLLYNSAGCFLVFKFMRTCIQELHTETEYEHLTSLTFKASELKSINWLKKEKEFLFQGKRYDVVNVVKTDDSCTYWCFADEEEDRMFENLDRYHTENPSFHVKHKSQATSITLFYPVFFTKGEKYLFHLFMISMFPVPIVLNHYTMVYLEVNHPPPSFI
jgi:hypothetical protein